MSRPREEQIQRICRQDREVLRVTGGEMLGRNIFRQFINDQVSESGHPGNIILSAAVGSVEG